MNRTELERLRRIQESFGSTLHGTTEYNALYDLCIKVHGDLFLFLADGERALNAADARRRRIP